MSYDLKNANHNEITVMQHRNVRRNDIPCTKMLYKKK